MQALWGDWLRRQEEGRVAGLERVNRELIQRALGPEAEKPTLDVYATEIKVDKQEAQWTCYHVNGLCVADEFREGNASPDAGVLAFAKKRDAVLLEGRQVHFRDDRGAYQAEVINHYSRPGCTFMVTADLDVAVKRQIKNVAESARQTYRTAESLATDRQIVETVYTMNGTPQAFRLIVLRWLNPQPSLSEAERYGYYAVPTNREESAAEVMGKHNGWGQSENGTKN